MRVADQTPTDLPPGVWQDLLRHAYALIGDRQARHRRLGQ